MRVLKGILAYHVSYTNGQRFVIYKDGSHTMFSHIILDKPDEYYPDETTYDQTLHALFYKTKVTE